jgi:hypothetical protein
MNGEIAGLTRRSRTTPPTECAASRTDRTSVLRSRGLRKEYECGDAAADVPVISCVGNLLPPERNREAMDDDELIAAMAGGGDTARRELFARHALAGGHEPVHRPDAAAVRPRLRGRGSGSGSPVQQAVQAALLRGAGIPFAAQAKLVAAAENFPGRAPGPVTGPVYTAARRLAALPAAARHASLLIWPRRGPVGSPLKQRP